MADLQISSNEIQLCKQQIQRHYIKLILLNQSWNPIGTIQGVITSGNVSIDASSNIRRTASLSVIVDMLSVDVVASITMNTYVQIKCGIVNNFNDKENWYNLGYYITNQSSYKFDPKTRTLDISLSDLMLDLTGDRAGTLHAYTTLVKNEQRIDTVMENVLKLVGFTNYNITPICVQRPTSSYFDGQSNSEDYLIPYDIDFNAGVTAYEILEKLVSLYPYYQMYFDVNGTFVCEKKITEQDSSFVLLDAPTLRGLVISEDTSIDWTKVKNIIEVWGKDGLYYGEARDEVNGSPFNVNAIQPLRYVVTNSEEGIDVNNICDRYKDSELAEKLLKEQAKYEEQIAKLSKIENPTNEEKTELARAKANLNSTISQQSANISVRGNDLAIDWAKYILNKKCRMNETISLQLPLMPFITDVNFKISYSTKIDNQIKTWMITSVSHDLGGKTTTLTGMHFYEDTAYNYWDALETPVVTDYSAEGMMLTVTVDAVTNATYYELVIDHKPVAKSTSTVLSYTLSDTYAGEHTFYVRACGDGYRDGKSIDYTFTVEPIPEGVVLGTNTGYRIVTNTGNRIGINEGE